VNHDASALNPAQRRADIEELKNQEFDILVVGGGIVGSGIALDASSRGLRVALIEQYDFASGTSSRSSKLIHGGLRYLEQFDFKLVRQAILERQMMVTHQAPHLVKPITFIYPLHRKYIDRVRVGVGLLLYDLLQGTNRALPWHAYLAGADMVDMAHSLNPETAFGGFLYFDAQVDDARHTMMVARTAKSFGAQIATGAKVIKLTKSNNAITGASIETDEGERIEVRSKVVIAAAGVWNESIYEQINIEPSYKITMSKGVHITLLKDAIDSKSGIIIKTETSVLFIIPWGNQWLLGTTDTPYAGDKTNPIAEEKDIQYIIDQANTILKPQISREQIIGAYAGIRPLVANKKSATTAKIPREHTVDHPLKGFVSIAGGKYTIYRIMAKEAVDTAVKDLKFKVVKSSTGLLPLLGAREYPDMKKRLTSLAQERSMSIFTIEHLLSRYGSASESIFSLIENENSLGEVLIVGHPYLKAEVLYAVTHEGARGLIDILSRRLRIVFEAKDCGVGVAQYCAELVAPFFGWNRAEIRRQVKEFTAYAKAETAAISSGDEEI